MIKIIREKKITPENSFGILIKCTQFVESFKNQSGKEKKETVLSPLQYVIKTLINSEREVFYIILEKV